MGDKWIEEQFAPVLTKDELHALWPDLELNPVLSEGTDLGLVFNFITGEASMTDNQGRPGPLSQRYEPATLPQVDELIIMSKNSPWCTVVSNPHGVTVDDVFQSLYECYVEIMTEDEMAGLSPRNQDQMMRTRGLNMQTEYASGVTFRHGEHPRYDHLRNFVFFHHLLKDNSYVQQRLHYTAPNIFVMRLLS
ncbi:hypothetical protein M422DRAFT_773892 [Sphaerobolus stellatus SS14]|nr:hypothetical protein M422DRAFT_773892 [Sphaerobolus stellatus SS14]